MRGDAAGPATRAARPASVLTAWLLIAACLLATATPVGAAPAQVGEGGDEPTMPEPTADPEEVRREAERILRDGDFGRSSDETIPDRSLPEGDPGDPGEPPQMREPPSTPTFSGMGAIGQAVMWILVVAVVVLALWLLWMFLRKRVGRKDPAETDDDFVVEERAADAIDRPSDEWLAMAEEAEGAGRWREGLLYRYRSLVVALVDAGVVEPVAGRTVGEHREDVAARVPGGSEAFDEAAWLFERAWYGERPTGPDERDRFQEMARLARSSVDRPAVGASA